VSALVLVLLASAAISHVAGRDEELSGRTPVRYGCFAFTVALSRPTVAAGAPITFTAVARNVTSDGCLGPGCGGLTPSYDVVGLFGQLVYRDGGAGVACRSDAPPPRRVPAGGTIAWSVESWDGHQAWHGVCEPGNCRPTRPVAIPGVYRIEWHVVPGMSVGSAWFDVT
jgi:hypothetical protein